MKQQAFPLSENILDFLPDETLFSWCSRYHQLAVNGRDQTTSMQLFSSCRGGLAYDFPAGIDRFVARTDDMFGTAEQIISERTLLPFYLPFRPKQQCLDAIHTLKDDSIRSLKYRLGLLTSGLGAFHPLKTCPECMQSDGDDYGWQYWHRSHQLPGVWICPKHHVPLWSDLYQPHHSSTKWILPNKAGCTPISVLTNAMEDSGKLAWLIRMANMSCALLACEPGTFDCPKRIATALKERLKIIGAMHATGRVKWYVLTPWLEGMAHYLTCIPGMNHQVDYALLQSQFTRVLSGRSLSHPIRYLSWIATWYDNLDEFLRDYQYVTVSEGTAFPAKQKHNIANSCNQSSEIKAIIEAVAEGKLTVTAAAKQSGVSYSTMAAWLTQYSLLVPRRPKKLKGSTWSQAVKALRNGAEKKHVAATFGISIVTVTRIMRTVPHLQEKWHKVRYESKCIVTKAAWMKLCHLYPDIGIQELRNLDPATYAWLYRNEKAWLDHTVVRVKRLPRCNNAQMRMKRADARMAGLIQNYIVVNIDVLNPWTLNEIFQVFPRVRKVFELPELWPVTYQVLSAVLNQSSEKTLLRC